MSTAILVFTKTDAGGTDNVWLYNMEGDGFTLDDKRDTDEKHNDVPDILARWANLDGERDRARTEKSFLVPKSEIAENGYDFSFNKYTETDLRTCGVPANQGDPCRPRRPEQANGGKPRGTASYARRWSE